MSNRHPPHLAPSTPHRQTHIFLDEARPTLVEPPYAIARDFAEIGAGAGFLKENVAFREAIGWRLETDQDDPGAKRFTTAGNAGIMTAGMLSVAPNHEFVETFHRDPDGSYNGSAATSGDAFLFKKVPAGGSLDQRLVADQTAVPSPSFGLAGEPMDRIVVANSPQGPYQKRFQFSVAVPATITGKSQALGTYYFKGPPSNNQSFIGLGYLAAQVLADGYMHLFEYGWNEPTGDYRWRTHYSFNLGKPATPGDVLTLYVEIIDAGRSYPYGGIAFSLENSRKKSSPKPAGFAALAFVPQNHAATAAATPGLVVWACTRAASPPTPGASPPLNLDRIRVDAPRNTRMGHQVVLPKYKASGYLVDGDFKLPFIPKVAGGPPFRVSWTGTKPPGTSITVRMFRADTNAELTAITTGDFFATFPVTEALAYYVRFDFAGDTTTTPTLTGYKVIRDGFTMLVDPGEFELEIPAEATLDGPGNVVSGTWPLAVPGSLEITQAGIDPSLAMATWECHDLVNVHDRLATRGIFTSRVETEYDPLDPDKRCILHRGYVVEPTASKPVKGSDSWASGRTFWTMTSAGMWDRLRSALSPVRFDWGGIDEEADPGPDGQKPSYKATDAVVGMLQWAGFPNSMINIPDLPLRLFFSNGTDFYVEPLANLEEMIQRIVRKYLGMRLVFCENSGTYGQWRLFAPTLPPYTPLLHFTEDRVPAGRAVHVPASYGLIGGRPVLPVKAGSQTFSQKKLEGNRIIVTASGYIGGSGGEAGRMTAMWHNFKSFNFLGLAPSHPHYPDPDHPDWCPHILEVVYVDPALFDTSSDGKWVRWALRRIASIAGHTVRTRSFEAPLALIDDPSDPVLAGKVRMPRYYDACTYNGQPFLIQSCDPFINKDGHQYARYTIEAPREDYL